MSAKEWRRKLTEGNPFVAKVQAQPKVFVMGTESGLA
jgi:hypothetical protein